MQSQMKNIINEDGEEDLYILKWVRFCGGAYVPYILPIQVNTNKMLVQNAIEMFTSIMGSLNINDQQTLLSFIVDNWKLEEMKLFSPERGTQEEQLNSIKKIIIDIRNRVPFDGILSSENIVPPIIGENSDCDGESTKHVDAFLYDDNEVSELIEEGKLQNLYCGNCGSNNVKECNIISHSTSVSAMLYIFNSVLPSLEGKTLLDVGSRLGAVLYGAHIFTSAKKIIGVEMNKELCILQCDILSKYNMHDRVEIVNRRIEQCPDIVQNSDVIIMNNPFEFYISESMHIKIWKFLKTNIQSGSFLVTRPPIETTFKNLKTGMSINNWVKPFKAKQTEVLRFFGSAIVDPIQHPNIAFYQVL